MRYASLKEFKDEEFRKLTGVKRATFEKMIEILKEAEKKKKTSLIGFINFDDVKNPPLHHLCTVL